MKAALRLVDSVGMMDPPISSLYLAFYQVLQNQVHSINFISSLTESGLFYGDDGVYLQASR